MAKTRAKPKAIDEDKLEQWEELAERECFCEPCEPACDACAQRSAEFPVLLEALRRFV